jgi:hypothetical protein
LDELLRLANERSVDLMIIGGELFDSAEDAEALRQTDPDYLKRFETRFIVKVN